jgi:hypothetical protein
MLDALVRSGTAAGFMLFLHMGDGPCVILDQSHLPSCPLPLPCPAVKA